MSMYDNFKNIPKDYIPNNRKKFIKKINNNIIQVGADCKHIFKMDLMGEENLTTTRLVYKQGISIILVRNNGLTIKLKEKEPHCVTIELDLPAKETILFNDVANRDVTAQFEFILHDGRVHYSPIFNIDVVKSIISKETPEDFEIVLGDEKLEVIDGVAHKTFLLESGAEYTPHKLVVSILPKNANQHYVAELVGNINSDDVNVIYFDKEASTLAPLYPGEASLIITSIIPAKVGKALECVLKLKVIENTEGEE